MIDDNYDEIYDIKCDKSKCLYDNNILMLSKEQKKYEIKDSNV